MTGCVQWCWGLVGQIRQIFRSSDKPVPLYVADRQQCCLYSIRGTEYSSGKLQKTWIFLSIFLMIKRTKGSKSFKWLLVKKKSDMSDSHQYPLKLCLITNAWAFHHSFFESWLFSILGSPWIILGISASEIINGTVVNRTCPSFNRKSLKITDPLNSKSCLDCWDVFKSWVELSNLYCDTSHTSLSDLLCQVDISQFWARGFEAQARVLIL